MKPSNVVSIADRRSSIRDAESDQSASPLALLTVVEVAAWLRVSEQWVRAHANGNRRPLLPCTKFGKVLRFQREDIDAFIDKWKRQAA